ncbi:hypothetical protein HYPSUDRAFT_42550 [Hypholoma sublateritium FD-334 SS-4]|uniref:Nephrocystin 3-like N-terminal domain-containing protein n=1 Tax=Hypholoma sublateritium (strain FD-334 SS-4) TaxID=945553 RepID=A0A0D2NWS1_HYPSF|nr:hypothetical protein HYPSUDRAFT_42550 [Hypholoma sublateritium FD-334 SS-4]
MPVFSQPTRQPDVSQHAGEFFTNARHTMITGGNFTNINHSITQKNGFQILQEHVATAAFHNSKERFDPPRCHEHTREAVLDEIFDWIVGTVPRETWIAWLNGAAGAGKSAICQSIAERCILHGILVASFFFFRTDSSRNRIDPLVVTLAYQIIQLLPETKNHIVEAIESNPLIFQQTFEAQLDMLIVRPLRLLQASYPALKLLLIIDGVDECDGESTQMNLIRTLAKLLRTKNLPFIVLFGSRRENQLLMAFNSRDMAGNLTQLPLDDNYQPEKDILRFLNDSFDEIKQTHPFGKRLGTDWPLPEHVQEIVVKSSGQFIYASVVINFLSAPLAHPASQLEIIRGLRPSGRLTPFAQLDALYSYVFSQVDGISTTLEFLAYLIFGDTGNIGITLHFFEFGDADAQSISAPLTSVFLCDLDTNGITFRHASLPDFLCDQGRSGEYCINRFATPLCIRWFQAAEAGRFRDLSYEEQNEDIIDLLQHAEITDELYASLVAYAPSQNHSAYSRGYFPKSLLKVIHDMDLRDGGKLYSSLLNTIVRYVRKEFPMKLEYLEEKHDVSGILAQLAAEEEAVLLPGPDAPADTDSASVEYEVPQASTSPQFDNARQPIVKISPTVDSRGTVDAIPTPSHGSLLAHTSPPNKRVWAPKTWFGKLGGSHTKK